MATSAISSTGTASTAAGTATATQTIAAQTAASNKANAQKILTSLGAGSGVDVASLAQSLVDAERLPQQNALNAKITKNESRISGFSAVSYVLSELQTAMTALKDQNSFNSLTPTNSNPSAFNVTVGATASANAHDVEVLQLAKPQRMVSYGSATASSSLNGGQAMTLNLTVGGVSKPAIALAAGKDTPKDMVDAINAANSGVKAQLINTGNGTATPYQIVLTGATGSAGAFSLNIASSSGIAPLIINSADAASQAATDAIMKVDGLTVTRSSNTVKDVVNGVTFDLKSTTSSAATVSFARDTTGIKDRMNALVAAYNDANSMFKVVTDPKSTVDTYGATLVGDSTVRNIRHQMRSIFQGNSSTPGTSVNALWQMGIKVDETGTMSLDATKLDSALQTNFEDVVKTLTGNTNGLSGYSTQNAGFMGDGIRKITKLLGPTGPMLSQSNNADTQNTKYRDNLAKLDARMSSLLARYTKQFAAMNSFVGNTNSQKTSLKSSFDGMMAMYTNK